MLRRLPRVLVVALVAGGHWPGRNVARDLQFLPGRADAGYVLDSHGGLKRFGRGLAAPRLAGCASPAPWGVRNLLRAVAAG